MIEIEQQLGIPGLFSQGLYDKYGAWWAGRKLLRAVWEKKPRTIRDTTEDLRELPFGRASLNILWRRELEPYMIGLWVHLFDKNSMYLAACKSVKTGIGNPVHRVKSFGWNPIDDNLPGIYRVEWDCSNSDFNGVTFPLIIEPTQTWITFDVLVFALEQGYQIEVQEAYVFPEYTRVLNMWASRLWDALASTKDVEPELYANLKAISHVGPGSFATGKNIHEGLDLIHPNWWADVVGKARVNLLANLTKYGAPSCIRTDGLFYISRDSNIRTAIPGIMDRLGMCGGYKIPTGWKSFRLTEEMYERSKGMNDAELSLMFKEEAGIKNDAE